MKSVLNTLVWAAIAAGLSSQAAYAQGVEAPSFTPFAGEAGFQEVRLAGDSWYVAFHGTRKHAIGAVRAGWLARAGQLCESVKRPYIVELRYAGQQVYEGDPIAQHEEFSITSVAGVVYIPMFIPSGPRTIPPSLTPSKAAAIRCVEQPDGLKANLVAVSVTDAKDAPRSAGVVTR